ncbi:hypothetical protein PLICRDRAFT_313275 [Plicaturopsis crispa FD-325 SS-3]|nr:hypothetical protein PLICRDRAFT_313275 [Plicaturopsis crispa FD-325 SS-3]
MQRQPQVSTRHARTKQRQLTRPWNSRTTYICCAESPTYANLSSARAPAVQTRTMRCRWRVHTGGIEHGRCRVLATVHMFVALRNDDQRWRSRSPTTLILRQRRLFLGRPRRANGIQWRGTGGGTSGRSPDMRSPIARADACGNPWRQPRHPRRKTL